MSVSEIVWPRVRGMAIFAVKTTVSDEPEENRHTRPYPSWLPYMTETARQAGESALANKAAYQRGPSPMGRFASRATVLVSSDTRPHRFQKPVRSGGMVGQVSSDGTRRVA